MLYLFGNSTTIEVMNNLENQDLFLNVTKFALFSARGKLSMAALTLSIENRYCLPDMNTC